MLGLTQKQEFELKISTVVAGAVICIILLAQQITTGAITETDIVIALSFGALSGFAVYRRADLKYLFSAQPDDIDIVEVLKNPDLLSPGDSLAEQFYQALRPDYNAFDVVRQHINPPAPAPSPVPAIAAHGTLFSEMRIDLNRYPHHLIIGETGSGKSTAAFQMIKAIDRQNNAEFVFIDYLGMDWQEMAVYQLNDIIEVIRGVYQEMRYRADLIRIASTPAARSLAHLPRIVVLIEETENLINTLRRQDKAIGDEVEGILIEIGNAGRKPRVHLVAITQKGDGRSLDTRFRAQMTLWLMAGIPAAQMRALDCPADLTTLPPGVAWSSITNDLVQFEVCDRPRNLKLWAPGPGSGTGSGTGSNGSNGDFIDSGTDSGLSSSTGSTDPDRQKILSWESEGRSWNWMVRELGGNRSTRLSQIRGILGN